MKKHISLGFLCLLCACHKNPKDLIQGRWQGQNIVEQGRGVGLPLDTLNWAKSFAIEFQGSQATVSVPAESPRSGKFKVIRKEDNLLTLQFTRPGGTYDESLFRMDADGKTLYWLWKEGSELVMHKVQ